MILLLILITLMQTGFDDDQVSLLSSADGKSWILKRDVTQALCSSSADVQSDNTYKFLTNGTFEFDHGAITEDPQCTDNCCSDFVNIVGRWEFTNGQTGIKIIADYEKNNPSNTLGEVLLEGSIVVLNENVLKISQIDPDTDTTLTFEFHKK